MKLVIVRHGQSIWNLENKFTGWVDIDLSEKGIKEAYEAGEKIKGLNINFDVAYTSKLKRAINTYKIINETLGQNLKCVCYQELNERHYGDLQGLNKDKARKMYGEEQVKLWRRSYDVVPPNGESLKDTLKRVNTLFQNVIKQDLLNGKNVLIVAHGNSLRALIKILENISDEDIMNIELNTGCPILYEFDENLKIKNKEELQ